MPNSFSEGGIKEEVRSGFIFCIAKRVAACGWNSSALKGKISRNFVIEKPPNKGIDLLRYLYLPIVKF